jgi:hypothetical protein
MNQNQSQVLTVNSEQAKRIIALCWKAQGIAKANGIPTLWLMTNSYMVPPWGQRIVID